MFSCKYLFQNTLYMYKDTILHCYTCTYEEETNCFTVSLSLNHTYSTIDDFSLFVFIFAQLFF